MAASSEGEVEIVFRGRDEVSSAITGINGELTSLNGSLNKSNTLMASNGQTIQQVNKQQREMMLEQRVVRRQFMLNNQTFFESTRFIGSVGGAAMKVNSIFLGWNALQIRQAKVNEDVKDTYDDMQRAIARYGAGSEQAKKATERHNKALEAQKQLAMELPGQYLALGLSTFSLASDVGKIAANYNELAFSIKKGGGLGALLRRGIGSSGGGGVGSLIGGALPSLGGGVGGGPSGLLGKIGGLKGVAGLGIGIGGIATSLALTNGKDNTTRALGVAGSAASGALGGFMVGNIPGAVVGGVLGLVTGLASNYGEEFGNLFAGKGFKSNKDAGVDGGITVNGDMNINSTGTDAQQLIDDMHRTIRVTARLASPQG